MFLGVINVDATLCFAYEEIEINPAYFQSRVAFCTVVHFSRLFPDCPKTGSIADRTAGEYAASYPELQVFLMLI